MYSLLFSIALAGFTSGCTSDPAYFYPWEPFGYTQYIDPKNGAVSYPSDCQSDSRGYVFGVHTPSDMFWGWGNAPGSTPDKYYGILDKMFQAIQGAQLQLTEFDIYGEIDPVDFPVEGRWIQDNEDQGSGNNNVLKENVYLNVCAHLAYHGLVGKNGECVATYSTTVNDKPQVSGTTQQWQDCPGPYGDQSTGDSAMFPYQSTLMHAFAGDWFGPIWADENLIGVLTFPYGPDYICYPPITQAHLDPNVWFTLAEPNDLVVPSNGLYNVVPPYVIDVHGAIANGLTPSGQTSDQWCTNPNPPYQQYKCFWPDPNIAQEGYTVLYNLATQPHQTVNGDPAFTMPTTAPYPIMIGETFPNEPGCDDPPVTSGTTTLIGASEEYQGFMDSALFSAMGAQVIFRPWHYLSVYNGGGNPCMNPNTPPTIGFLSGGPYHTYENQ